ncbi:MAG: hypothetical protein ACLGIW_17360 [Gammaproteobacteria bacterium]
MPETVAAGLRLAPDALTRPFEPSQFNFKTTAELEPFLGVLGQERAVEALALLYPSARPEVRRVAPQELGLARIGHFGFFRRQFADSLWTPRLLPELMPGQQQTVA